MGKDSAIGWTHATFNMWRGCTKVSAGCASCYAETLSRRNPATLGVWGPAGTRVVASEATWREPLKWDREARAAGERRRVFTASLADVFEDWPGPMVDSKGRVLHYNSAATWWVPDPTAHSSIPMRFVRERLATLILACEHLDFLLLTKRPENAGRMLGEMFDGPPPPNLWLGVTAEDQEQFNRRVAILRDIPAVVRFVSLEPLLGPIDMGVGPLRSGCGHRWYDGPVPPEIDWAIVGGESGPRRRPMELAWLESIVEQCRAAGVPLYVKQASALRDGQQGEISAELWATKEFPRVAAPAAPGKDA